MKYCEKCGASTASVGSHFKCTKCGKTFYSNPKAAVAVVLYVASSKQILLGRRARTPQVGKLDFLGGFLDAGETFEQAAYRELKEESGLISEQVGTLRYVTSMYNGYEWEGDVLPTTSVCYIAELLTDADVTAADDVSSFEMYVIDTMPANEDCAWEDMPRVLREVAQVLAVM